MAGRRRLSQVLRDELEALPNTPETAEQRNFLLRQILKARDQEFQVERLRKTERRAKRRELRLIQPIALPGGSSAPLDPNLQEYLDKLKKGEDE